MIVGGALSEAVRVGCLREAGRRCWVAPQEVCRSWFIESALFEAVFSFRARFRVGFVERWWFPSGVLSGKLNAPVTGGEAQK